MSRSCSIHIVHAFQFQGGNYCIDSAVLSMTSVSFPKVYVDADAIVSHNIDHLCCFLKDNYTIAARPQADK